MRSTSRTVATALNAVVLVTAAALIAVGCGAETGSGGDPPSAAAYWDSSRLLGARPFIAGQRSAPATGQVADSHIAGPRQGLLLFQDGHVGRPARATNSIAIKSD
jgi:hypothetical protein